MKSIDEMKNPNGELDYNAIKAIIPYEIPFMMIDKVKELSKDKIIAVKAVTGNEQFFNGHFAGFPIMPGALIVEGMGQAGTLLVRYNLENHYTKDVLAYKIKEAKFKEPVFPGETLVYEIAMLGMDERGAMLNAVAKTTEGREIALCALTLAVVDRKTFRSKYSAIFK
jgi:3-hydroxymyristoyl/3-hydroxydecanoyl-(acyl carrier protein) dehydratase